MPAPGDQYGAIPNPFEERVVNEFTAKEIATLQSRLNKQLGPEYISQRPGNGGGRVAYLEGNKAIALANEVFGFNGWSSSLGQVQIDYVDENPQNGKVSLGLSIVVRITLKGGTFHEDIGYGSIDNGKGKAASFEKAKKEAATDGLKRALRTFGNVLGNCLYDKEYLKKVQTMKVKPIKFNEDRLHRHPDFAPRQIKDEAAMVKREEQQTPIRTNILRTRTDHLNGSLTGEFDDEFDGNLFDGMDMQTGEEGTLDSMAAPEEAASKALGTVPQTNASHGSGSSRGTPASNGGAPRQQNPRMQTAPQQQNNAAGRPPPNAFNARAPQTPIQQSNARPDASKPRMAQPAGDVHAASKPQNPPQHSNKPAQQPPQNQPLKPTPSQAQQQQPNAALGAATPTKNPPSNHRPPVGFVTSRAAELMQNADSASSLTHLPSFNPHADSPIPKDQRTSGVDHTRSVPIKRDTLNAALPPTDATPAAAPNTSAFNRPSAAPRATSNFVNPHQDTGRRIGMPGGGANSGAMSPSVNRGAYKPPMKRPPLQDVSNQNAGGHADAPEAKRQKVETAGMENAGPAAAGV